MSTDLHVYIGFYERVICRYQLVTRPTAVLPDHLSRREYQKLILFFSLSLLSLILIHILPYPLLFFLSSSCRPPLLTFTSFPLPQFPPCRPSPPLAPLPLQTYRLPPSSNKVLGNLNSLDFDTLLCIRMMYLPCGCYVELLYRCYVVAMQLH